jgi:hypothetical protein
MITDNECRKHDMKQFYRQTDILLVIMWICKCFAEKWKVTHQLSQNLLLPWGAEVGFRSLYAHRAGSWAAVSQRHHPLCPSLLISVTKHHHISAMGHWQPIQSNKSRFTREWTHKCLKVRMNKSRTWWKHIFVFVYIFYAWHLHNKLIFCGENDVTHRMLMHSRRWRWEIHETYNTNEC